VARRNKKQLTRFEHPQLLNASKTLLANIRFASVDEPIKTIVVTSSAANEGKTIVATNLAYAIATSGRSVLIVEADMHYRSLNRLLDQHPTYGLYAALSGAAPLDKVIVPTRIANLHFMDAEPNIPSPSDILDTKRCATLIETLHEMFDYVIFDTPPVSLFVDAAILSNRTNGTLFVVRQNQTKRALAAKCVQQLQVANARILGLVATFCQGDDSLYYYAYYTQDGKRANKDTFKHSTKSVESPAPAKSVESPAPARPLVIEPDRSAESVSIEFEAPTRPAPSKSAASARIVLPDPKADAPDTPDVDDASSTNDAYAPNAYRELPARRWRTSGQQRRR
jgi:capsular exopolysaccharide synthesis family protein